MPQDLHDRLSILVLLLSLNSVILLLNEMIKIHYNGHNHGELMNQFWRYPSGKHYVRCKYK